MTAKKTTKRNTRSASTKKRSAVKAAPELVKYTKESISSYKPYFPGLSDSVKRCFKPDYAVQIGICRSLAVWSTVPSGR